MIRTFRPNTKGFTLIELAVVIAVIAILAAVAIPRFGNTTATAECSNMKGFVTELMSAMSIYTAENAMPPTGFNNFVSQAALTSPAPGTPTISTIAFGTNAITSPCVPSGNTITCSGTFNSYNPVTYSFNNGVLSLTTATPVGTAGVCIR
jgi:prepilin-type N-terminal cleavage/methylation domain-containing protein